MSIQGWSQGGFSNDGWDGSNFPKPQNKQNNATQTIVKSNGGSWGDGSSFEDSNAGGWGAIVNPSVVGNIQPQDIFKQSSKFIDSSAENGILSIKKNQQDDKHVDKMLDSMFSNMTINMENITQIVKDFQSEVQKANKKIGEYCRSIINRGINNDPTLQKGELEKANMIVAFTNTSLEMMSTSSGLALDLADKGMGIITKQTQAAIGVIFDARIKQVQLFSQQIAVFHQHEEQKLKNVIILQEAKMKEQQQFFTQLKEIVQIEESKKELYFKQGMEKQKFELEKNIQIAGLELKEQELQIHKELENKKADLHHSATVHEINQKTTLGMHQVTTDASTQRHKIDRDADSKNLETVTNLAKPACAIQ